MAIKPPDLLNRLPSVSELLDKPPIRALADRWNRSVVAGGVRSFLDELRSDLKRRAADMELPSIRELSERAARFVVSRQHASLGTAINATGQIWGSPWASRPLSDAALERAVAVGREFAMNSAPNTGALPVDVEPLLCRLTGAQAAVAVHSYSGALWLTLSAVAADREVLVARGEIDAVGYEDPLPKLAAKAKAFLKEVGTTNRALIADYETAASPHVAALLKLSPEGYRVVGDTAKAELDELVPLARDRELLLIDALGTAPLVEPAMALPSPKRSVRASIAAGVDVTLVRGDGFVGGPPCGIIVGCRDAIRRIAEHPLFAAWRLDRLRSAALVATLESYDQSPHGEQALPVWEFLTTPIENLRNRAERIAPQLAQVSGISSAVAVETRSPLAADLGPESVWQSYGIALTAADGDIHALDNRLRTASVPILGRIENDRLVLDLRTVIPRQDKTLVDALLEAPSVETTASATT